MTWGNAQIGYMQRTKSADKPLKRFIEFAAAWPQAEAWGEWEEFCKRLV